MTRVQIRAVEDPAALAARLIAEGAREAVASRGRAILALSGGSSAPPLLDSLAAEEVPWPHVVLLQVDERVAPDGHDDRNATALVAHLVDRVDIPDRAVHLMPVADREPEEAAVAYQTRLAALQPFAVPVLDVVHLGLGEDGHTASLIPDDPVLGERRASVAATGVYLGRRRVTLTFPVLDLARQRIWLVPGDGKGSALRALRDGDPSMPAGRVEAADDALVITAGADHGLG